MAIWLAGFIAGVAKARRNILLQAYLFIILYFISGSIINIMWLVGERFRAPIMPFIAVISAYGWISIISAVRSRAADKKSAP
jgi:hypothetical protein